MLQSPSNQDLSLKQSGDRFREISKTTSKTALLWVAALAIVWLTGLERIRRDVTDTLNAIQHNNWEKQKLVDNRVKTEFESLRNLKTKVEEEKPENADRTIARLKKEIAKKETTTDKKQALEGSIKYWKERKKHYEDDNKRLLERSNQHQEQANAIASQRAYLEKGLAELRAKKEGVSFDILSQKFEVPRLYAAVLWSLFMVGLIVYLLRARGVLLTIYATTLRAIRTSTGLFAPAARELFSDVPWWCTPLPDLPPSGPAVLLRNDPISNTGTQVVREEVSMGTPPAESEQETPHPVKDLDAAGIAQVPSSDYSDAATQATATDASKTARRSTETELALANEENAPPSSVDDHKPRTEAVEAQSSIHIQDGRALNWQHQSVLASVIAPIGPLLLSLSLVRVIWLGLEMIRQLGNTHQRAFVLVSLAFIVVVTFLLLAWWFRQPYVAADSVETIPAWVILALVPVLSGLAVVLYYIWNRPRVVNQWRARAEDSLPKLAVLLTIVMVGIGIYQGLAVLRRNRRVNRHRQQDLDRRQILAGMIALLGVLGLRRAAGTKLDTHLTNKPRFVKDKQHRKNHLLAPGKEFGFYLNNHTNIVHFVNIAKVVAGIYLGKEVIVAGKNLRKDEEVKLVERLSVYEPLSLPVRRKSQRNKWTSSPTLTMARDAGAIVTEKPIILNLMKTNFERSELALRPVLFSTKKRTVALRMPRVHLTTSSNAFEQTALFILGGTYLVRRDHETVCEFLVYALNHDLYLSTRSNRLPSFRLYDLLAGLSVRYDLLDYFRELLRLVKDFGLEQLFQARLKKWQDVNSVWHKRWSSQEKKVNWGGKNGVQIT